MSDEVVFDTETHLFSPGNMAPRLVVLSWASKGREGLVLAKDASKWLLEAIESNSVFIGHNVAFDFAVLAQHDSALRQHIFNLYQRGRVICTKLSEQLLDIAEGCLRYKRLPNGKTLKRGYSLAETATRYGFRALAKGEDTWRMRYAQLDGVPLGEWPEEAISYPLDDIRATSYLRRKQLERDSRIREGSALASVAKESREFFALKLVENYGLRTNAEGVSKLEVETQLALEKAKANLVRAGLVKASLIKKTGELKYTRDTKAAKKRIFEVCREQGIPLALTDRGVELKINPASEDAVNYAALDASACEETEDPVLKDYAALSSLSTVLNKDLKFLRDGIEAPIHTTFNLVNSGRLSSSKPNVQNIRRLPGIRECFTPRPNYVYAQADYDGLELRTMAQVFKLIVGFSHLGELLNQGIDLHTNLAASFLGISYEEALKNKKEKAVYEMRQLAKAFHFGKPGGLGDVSFVDYAYTTYGVEITKNDARLRSKQYFEKYPEIQRYFAFVKQILRGYEPREAVIQQLISKRLRGGCTFTAACNSFFQGLGADVTKNATWLIVRACETGKAPGQNDISPLFGSHLVNVIHDEFIVETPDIVGKSSDAAYELSHLMRVGAQRYLPDYPATTEPCLMRYWSKEAQSIFDRGRLIPWG